MFTFLSSWNSRGMFSSNSWHCKEIYDCKYQSGQLTLWVTKKRVCFFGNIDHEDLENCYSFALGFV